MSNDLLNNVHVLSAIFGTSRLELETDKELFLGLLPDYSLGPGASPWARQFAEDIGSLALIEDGIEVVQLVGEEVGRLFIDGPARDLFLLIDFSELRASALSVRIAPPGFEVDKDDHVGSDHPLVQEGGFVCGIDDCCAWFSDRKKCSCTCELPTTTEALQVPAPSQINAQIATPSSSAGRSPTNI